MAKTAKKTSRKPASKEPAKANAKAGAKASSKNDLKAKQTPKKDAKSDKKKSDAAAVKTKAKTEVKPKADAKPKATPKKADKPASKAAEKNAKKKPRRSEEEDEFLPEAIDGGEEELPDLEEFEEAEELAEEPDLDEDDDSEDLELLEPADDEVVLTDAEGRRYCKVKDCDQIGVVDAYCRYHYLLLWKKIQVRRKILADGKLERYVEELTARYPDKFLEMIRRDLKTEKDFQAAIAELEIDESSLDNEYEDEAQSYIDEVRGVSETSGMSDDEEF